MHSLTICHLYPDLMNLYGDRGNILALRKRCEWRGIDSTVEQVSMGDRFDAERYDIVFMGGGQDYEQEIIQSDLFGEKQEAIRRAVESDVVFLAICGGYQLLGKYYQTHEGSRLACLDICDWHTEAGRKRLIGNLVFETELPGTGPLKVVGFENHSGKTWLGKGVQPLGKVLSGNGNNGTDGFEGAIWRNVHASYSHGSLLPKNPSFTDHLLTLALKRRYPDFIALTKLDDSLETHARETLLKRFL